MHTSTLLFHLRKQQQVRAAELPVNDQPGEKISPKGDRSKAPYLVSNWLVEGAALGCILPWFSWGLDKLYAQQAIGQVYRPRLKDIVRSAANINGIHYVIPSQVLRFMGVVAVGEASRVAYYNRYRARPTPVASAGLYMAAGLAEAVVLSPLPVFNIAYALKLASSPRELLTLAPSALKRAALSSFLGSAIRAMVFWPSYVGCSQAMQTNNSNVVGLFVTGAGSGFLAALTTYPITWFQAQSVNRALQGEPKPIRKTVESMRAQQGSPRALLNTLYRGCALNAGLRYPLVFGVASVVSQTLRDRDDSHLAYNK